MLWLYSHVLFLGIPPTIVRRRGGINAVMRSWPGLGSGSVILLLSIGYDGKTPTSALNAAFLLSASPTIDRAAGFYNVYSWLRETLGVELLVVRHKRPAERNCVSPMF